MVAFIGFITICGVWLTILTAWRRKQQRQINRDHLEKQENIIRIRQLMNEIEYLKMILYGKEESSKENKSGKA